MRKVNAALRGLGVCVAMLTALSCGGGGGGGGNDGVQLSNDSCGVLGLKIIDGASCREQNSPVVGYEVFYSNRTPTGCSGTMITPTFMLTAAHCLADSGQNVTQISVTFNGTPFAATAFGVHPEFAVASADVPGGEALYNDVALIEIANAPTTPTVPLLTSRPVQGGDIFSIFGYGFDEDGNADQLKSGEMLLDHNFGNFFSAKFGDEGSNTCQGDSGGPAIYSFGNSTGIVGITSSGDPTTGCLKGDTSLFANIQDGSIIEYLRSNVPGLPEI